MMDPKRKGEIALAILKHRIGHEGIQLNPNSRRRLGNIARATGIPLVELKEFAREVTTEMIKECLR